MLSAVPEDVRTRIEQSGQMDRMKEQLVTEEVLYQEAIKRNLHKDTATQTLLIMAERQALVQALLQGEVESRSTDEALKKWYDEHQVQFRADEVLAKHILVETEAEAKAIKAELDGGADFATVAGAKSKDPGTAAKGGEIGWLPKRQTPPTMASLFDAEKGAVLDPIQSPSGWHVFKVEDKRTVKPFDEVKDEIKGRMQSEIVETVVKELTEAAKGGAAEGGAAAGGAAPAGDAAGAGEGH